MIEVDLISFIHIKYLHVLTAVVNNVPYATALFRYIKLYVFLVIFNEK